MKKTILAILAFLLLTPLSSASAITHVKIGEILELNANTIIDADSYQWILKEGDEIITKIEGAQLKYSFSEAGDYTANLVAVMRNGSTKDSIISIEVSDEGFVSQKSFQAILSTLPQKSKDGIVLLENNNQEVVFILSASEGDIKEYKIDTNLNLDTDGDGNPVNDVDNKHHNSMETGNNFAAKFLQDAEVALTILGKDGREDTDIVKIVVGDSLQKNLEAKMSSFPPSDEDGIIHLSGESEEVSFFLGDSTGNIKEYRIDRNIAEDSDEDGDATNDIDNLQDNSFSNGGLWKNTYNKADGEAIVQLTVVSTDKKGSRLKRKIVFDDQVLETEKVFVGKLLLDKSEIDAGETIGLSIFPVPDNAKFTWDFDGDGISEIENENPSMSYLYEVPGEFNPTVIIETGEGMFSYSEKLVVNALKNIEDFDYPTADFSFNQENNVFSFVDNSQADSKLSNVELSYSWDFGDGETSAEASPTHEYKYYGDFNVVLTVSDSVEHIAKKSSEIHIDKQEGLLAWGATEEETETPPVDPVEVETPPAEEEVVDNTINPGAVKKDEGMGLVTILLILLIGLLILVPIIFLAIEKVRHPSMTWGEIIEGLKEKFINKAGKPASTVPAATDEQVTQAVATEDVQAETATEEVPIDEKPAAEIEAAPVEAETETDTSTSTAENVDASSEPAPLDVQDGAMPDWLKTGDEASATPAEAEPENQAVQEEEPVAEAPEVAGEENVSAETTTEEVVETSEPEVSPEPEAVEPVVEPEVAPTEAPAEDSDAVVETVEPEAIENPEPAFTEESSTETVAEAPAEEAASAEPEAVETQDAVETPAEEALATELDNNFAQFEASQAEQEAAASPAEEAPENTAPLINDTVSELAEEEADEEEEVEEVAEADDSPAELDGPEIPIINSTEEDSATAPETTAEDLAPTTEESEVEPVTPEISAEEAPEVVLPEGEVKILSDTPAEEQTTPEVEPVPIDETEEGGEIPEEKGEDSSSEGAMPDWMKAETQKDAPAEEVPEVVLPEGEVKITSDPASTESAEPEATTSAVEESGEIPEEKPSTFIKIGEESPPLDNPPAKEE